MAERKILLRRGLKANLPTLDEGEPGFTTDEAGVYIGSQYGNVRLQNDLGVVSVKDPRYGAVGDGVTDDYQAFADALTANDVVFVPAGTYYLSQGLTIGEFQHLIGAGSSLSTLLFADTVQTGLTVDSNAAVSNLKVERNVDAPTLADPKSGIMLTGSRGWAFDITIHKFERGLHLLGDGRGCAYNQVFVRQILNCYYGICLDAKNDGWVNENTITGGNLTNDTSWRTSYYDGNEWGIWIDSQTGNAPNGNKFMGVSVEGFNQGIRCSGVYNIFIDCRVEIPGTIWYLFQDNANWNTEWNYVIGVYGLLTLGQNFVCKDSSGATKSYNSRNIVLGRGIPLFAEYGLQLHSYYEAIIRYIASTRIFDVSHQGTTLLQIKPNGDLYIRGRLYENQWS